MSQIRLVQKSVDENSSILKTLLEQLNDQVATTNLRMKTLAKFIQSQGKNLGDLVGELQTQVQNLSVKWDDTNSRISTLQQKLQENQLQVQSLRETPGELRGSSIQPDQTYSAIYNDYLMGNYDLAIAGFQDFLSNFPDGEYADNASYYLGVCYYEKKRYETSIQAFNQVINLYPNGDKTPPAYYKKALALEQLQKNNEAIETLKKLLTIFPDSQEARMAHQELSNLGVKISDS